MSVDPRALVVELGRQAWTLSSLSVAAERGVLAALASGPCTIEAIAATATIATPTARALADVLAALGLVTIEGDTVRDAGTLAAFGDPGVGRMLAADIRSTLGTTRDAAYAAERHGEPIEGWRAIDPVAVRAQGIVSHAVTMGLRDVLRGHPEHHAMLSREGARFLDVGAGAAGLSIAYAKLYPTLRVTGIEPSELACAEAQRAIEAAGVGDRVEIRRALGQEIGEEGVFVAAYVAQMFIPDQAIDPVLRATLRAMVPGGWLSTGAVAVRGPDLAPSISRFRNAIWGGGVRSVADVTSRLESAGFVGVMALPGPGGMVPILGRRPA